MTPARLSVLLVFGDEWGAYSGPLRNLVRLLAPRHDVRALCFDNGEFRVDGLPSPPFEIIRVPHRLAVNAWRDPGGTGRPHLVARLVRRALNRNLRHHERIDLYTALKIDRLVRRLAGRAADRVIAFDTVAALACSLVFDRFTFWSIECHELPLYHLIPEGRIGLFVIQSAERHRRIFGSVPHEVLYIPDSHVFEGETDRSPMRTARRLVFFGNFSHATRFFCPFLRLLPEYTLTITGFGPRADRYCIEEAGADLIAAGRLRFDETYVPLDRIVEYLRGFSIGLVFYDTQRVRNATRRMAIYLDDYLLCPSGKRFTYFAAGLPAVGNRLPGLAAIEEYGAGILVDEDPAPEAIAEAVRKIEHDYDRYVAGAFRAARAYDQRALAAPFIERLEAEPPARARPSGAARDLVRAAGRLAGLARGVRPTERGEIEALARRLEGRPVVAYGVGDLLEFLIRARGLGRLNLVAAADSSPARQGTRVRGLPVIRPERIPDFARDVVVTSFEHEAEIAATVRRLHGDAVAVHSLYPGVPLKGESRL